MGQDNLLSLKWEKKRWTEDSNRFDQEKKFLEDSANSEAIIAYSGSLKKTFRKNNYIYYNVLIEAYNIEVVV